MNKNLHNIDRFFKEKIEGHKEEPENDLWAVLDRQLDKSDLLKAKYKYRVLRNAVAAVLLIGIAVAAGVFTYNLDKPAGDSKNKMAEIKVAIEKEAVLTPSKASDHSSAKKNAIIPIYNEAQAVKRLVSKSSAPGKDLSKADRSTDTMATRIKHEMEKAENSSGNIAKKNMGVESESSNLLSQVVAVEKSLLNKVNGGTISDNGHSLHVETESYVIGKGLSEIQRSVRPFSYLPMAEKIKGSKLAGVSLMPSALLPPISAIKHRTNSRFAISVVLMPEFVQQNIREGNRENREDDRHRIEAAESVNSSFSLGVTASLKFREKFQVFTGLIQSTTATTIHEQDLFARPRRDRPGQNPITENSFKINCAAGYAYVNSKTGQAAPSFGDSIKGLPSTARTHYVVIPAGIRYTISKSKFSLGLNAGLSFHVLSRATISANFYEPSGTKSTEIVSIQGLKKSYLSGLFGISVAYAVSPSLQIYCSPTSVTGISPINQNTPVSTRRSCLGVQSGISLSF